MQTSLNFQIGNQEIVNFLVEQQVQELQQQLDAMCAERDALGQERIDLTQKLRKEAIEATQRIIDEKILPALASIGVKQKTINSSMKRLSVSAAISTDGSAYVGVETKGDRDKPSLHYIINGIFNSLPKYKLNKSDSDKLIAIESQRAALSCKIHEVAEKIRRRDSIANAALAQMTRKLLEENPQIMQQLSAVCLNVSSSTKLLPE